MGGAGSLTVAALHPELIDGVVAMNGTANLRKYENFQEAIRASYDGDKQTVPTEYKRRNAELAPERLPMPMISPHFVAPQPTRVPAVCNSVRSRSGPGRKTLPCSRMHSYPGPKRITLRIFSAKSRRTSDDKEFASNNTDG
jgi:pimeloyl-ACP methyl ester carboxylesterase